MNAELSNLLKYNAPMSITDIGIALILGTLLSILLSLHFRFFSRSLSNRSELVRVLPFLTLIVVLVISVVKTSLALSLGLVGALSIVRFRTPIKEPEELVYIFMAIAIGLGLGANQLVTTTLCSIGILIITAGVTTLQKGRAGNVGDTYVNLLFPVDGKFTAEDMLSSGGMQNLLGDTKMTVNINRVTKTDTNNEITLRLNDCDIDEIHRFLKNLEKTVPEVQYTLIDQHNLPTM